MNKFLEAINVTTTENGAITNSSTNNVILDFFYHGGALRNDPNRAVKLFEKAFYADATTALRILFYLRDIRGGQGEREVFRHCMLWLSKKYPNWILMNMDLFGEYGRWDDIIDVAYKSKNDTFRMNVCQLLLHRLATDVILADNNKPISLLAKWMPSENASSPTTKFKADMFFRYTHTITPRKYRKLLSKLRRHITLVEHNLVDKDYSSIAYDKLPSKALLKYRKAFQRNDAKRYAEFMSKAAKGEVKVNAAALYPYEIVAKFPYGYGYNQLSKDEENQLEAMWNNLPDYVDNINGLVVADTSGSMNGRPIEVSISLAMYIAERNKNSAFKNCFITFSERPRLQHIIGNSLKKRIACVNTGEIANTNLQAVFDLILDRAVAKQVPVEDMPKILLIISDMEFDMACRNNKCTNFEAAQKKYKTAGYPMPKIVFWNVNSRSNQAPATVNDRGVLLLSGCSPSIMKYALGEAYVPMDVVREVTESDRYKNITFSVDKP